MASTTQVAECLTAILSSDESTRISGELKLEEYFASSPSASILSLSQLILAQDPDLRALCLYAAKEILTKCLEECLSPLVDSVPPHNLGSKLSVEVKTQIMQAIYQGLSDRDRKVRLLCLDNLCSITLLDGWPNACPNLFNFIIDLLSSGPPESVHSAMQFFSEFMKSTNHYAHSEVLPVLSRLLPVLLNILSLTETHSPPTRARTAFVFRSCLRTLSKSDKKVVKDISGSALPVSLEAFKILLTIDPLQDVSALNWDGLTIRTEVFITLNAVFHVFPRALPYLHDFLNISLSHLRALYPAFAHYYISAVDSAPPSSEDKNNALPLLICAIFSFLTDVTRDGKGKEWYNEANLSALVSATCNFVQMTDEDENTWTHNSSVFVQNKCFTEDNGPNVRVAGLHMFDRLMRLRAQSIGIIFQSTIQQIIQDSQQAREVGKADWWKPLEAVLAVIGSERFAIRDFIMNERTSGLSNPIDIEYLLTKVIPQILTLSEFPFLQGRGFIFASQFVELFSQRLQKYYLLASIKIIETSETRLLVKICLAKAVDNFCSSLHDSTLISFAPRIIKDLGLVLLMITSDESFCSKPLVLRAISAVIKIDKGKWLTPELTDALVLALLEAWQKINDPTIYINYPFEGILNLLAKSPAPGTYRAVMKQGLPALSSAVTSTKLEESSVAA